MADEPMPESETDDRGPDLDSERYRTLLDKALRQFDSVAVPQIEVRGMALTCRRFVHVPGAMWEGDLAGPFENTPKPEVDKITKSGEKIETDYRSNRIMVEFKADTSGDDETADTLNGMFRADMVHFGSDEAFDNAFMEGLYGGMGAWRVTTDYDDPLDPANDSQRVNPGVVILDADQSVFFGPSSRYDKSDAPWAFVVTADLRSDAEEQWPGRVSDWPMVKDWPYQWDWYRPDLVYKAEYYVKEDVSDKLLVFTQGQSGEERRFFDSEIDDGARKELRQSGWTMRRRDIKRCRVRKYILNGSHVLKDCGYIAGPNIPIVPFYGKRAVVDGVERFRGHVLKRMDMQRIYNSAWGRVLETNATSPQRTPIILNEQMNPEIANEWGARVSDRPSYLRLLAIRDNEGNIIKGADPSYLEPPEVPSATIAMLQASTADLADDADNADEVKANVSADAMDIAADRVDAKSGIYLDNFRLSMMRCGEVYLGMARDVYYEEEREVETRTVDGTTGQEELNKPVTDKNGVFRTVNDFSKGGYKVIADVQESTATKRQKTVRQDMAIAEIAGKLGAQDIGQAAVVHAILNQDGEGMTDWHDFARQKALAIGLVKPTPEEEQEIAQAQAQKAQQPNPQEIALQAALQEAQGKAAQAQATAQEKMASAHLKMAQADTLEKAPMAPTGLHNPPVDASIQAANDIASAHDTIASANLKNAQAAHLQSEIGRKRIMTGAELQAQQHEQQMREREHELARTQANRSDAA